MKRNNKIIVSLGIILCLLCCGVSKAQYIKFGYTYDRLKKGDTIVVNIPERYVNSGKFISNENLGNFVNYLTHLSDEGYKYKILIYFFEGESAIYCEKVSIYLKRDLIEKTNISPDDVVPCGNTRQLIVCDIRKWYCKRNNTRIEIVLMDKEEKEEK